MRRILFFLFLLVQGVVAQPAVAPFQKVAPGMEYREVTLSMPRSIRVLQLRCDPAKVKFRIIGSKKARATAKEVGQKYNQQAVINSSFFGHKDEILGYAKQGDRFLNPDIDRGPLLTTFFYWTGRRAGVKHRDESLPKSAPVLFQSGPRLVWDGAPVRGLDPGSLAERSGVTVDRQGRVTLFALGVSSELTLAELPELLIKPVEEGGVEAVRALNFDGGSSTQFYLNTESKTQYLPGVNRVPYFLGVTSAP